MNRSADVLNRCYSCLVENMGVVDTEYFIALIKNDTFDYTTWRREYFDTMPAGKFGKEASAYAKEHPYAGRGNVI